MPLLSWVARSACGATVARCHWIGAYARGGWQGDLPGAAGALILGFARREGGMQAPRGRTIRRVRTTPIRAAGVLLCVLGVLAGCSRPEPEAALRATLSEVQDSIERRDAGA